MRIHFFSIASKRVEDCIVRKYIAVFISYKLANVINIYQEQQGPQ